MQISISSAARHHWVNKVRTFLILITAMKLTDVAVSSIDPFDQMASTDLASWIARRGFRFLQESLRGVSEISQKRVRICRA